MNLQHLFLQDLAEAARIKSGELGILLEFINDAETDKQASRDCPEYVNEKTLGVILAAARDVATLLNALNEEMADRIGEQVEKRAAK